MIEIVHKFTCDICKDHREIPMKHFTSSDIPKPMIPAEWKKVDDLLFCPKHTIKTFIDGKEVSR